MSSGEGWGSVGVGGLGAHAARRAASLSLSSLPVEGATAALAASAAIFATSSAPRAAPPAGAAARLAAAAAAALSAQTAASQRPQKIGTKKILIRAISFVVVKQFLPFAGV